MLGAHIQQARLLKGIARVISRAGATSRSQAEQWVREGRVQVNGRVVRDPQLAVRQGVDTVEIDGRPLTQAARIVLMLNKPRGLVTTASDEQGRDTVYSCLTGADLPWLAPIGRLDKASEGLLLFSNDSAWAARITDPAAGPDKTYHVQVNTLPDAALLESLQRGTTQDDEVLAARSVHVLRTGGKNSWLEIVLNEGRNRHIRRLLAAFDIAVLRLVRVAVGPLQLGELAKGKWRVLAEREIDALGK